MKKIFPAVFCAAFLFACSDGTNISQETDNDTLSLPETTSGVDTKKTEPLNMDEGMMVMFGGKMMINKNRITVPMTEAVTCTDGCTVHPDGKVEMKNGSTMMMKEGDIIDKDGKMIHPSGKMVDVSDSL